VGGDRQASEGYLLSKRRVPLHGPAGGVEREGRGALRWPVRFSWNPSRLSGGVRQRRFRRGARQETAPRGNAQITLDKYPRIVFGVSVSLERVLDFTKRELPRKLVAIRQNCLAPDDLSPSMELGDLLRGRSIQGLVFRSAVGRGKNLIAYLEHCPANALEIHNAAELMKKMRQILKTPK
jgi:hypothetical protein